MSDQFVHRGSLAKNLLWTFAGYMRKHLDGEFCRYSYAQEGEDLILARIFEKRGSPGFYVDVGAHHPERFSNTYYFYKRGWRGINIDAMPGSMKLFNKKRPRDVNLETPISDAGHELTYFILNDTALNSFDPALTAEREAAGYRVVERRGLHTRPLRDVLSEHIPPGVDIQFLTVDVEGHDAAVLRGNDWLRFRPECVLVETQDSHFLGAPNENEIYCLMAANGYELFGKTFFTAVYLRRS